MRLPRPSHATIVAYLALFVALATGVSWAATKITSSKQISKNVIKAKHVKDGSLGGPDLKDGTIGGVDVQDQSLGGIDVKDGTLAGADLADGSVAGAEIVNGSITGAELNLAQLGFGQTYGVDNVDPGAIDNGGLSSTPRAPQGIVVSLTGLPAGRYLVAARIFVTSDSPDTDGGGAVCYLMNGNQNLAAAGASSDEDDFAGGGFVTSIPSSAAVTKVIQLSAPATLDYVCSDGNTGLQGTDAGIDAVKLPG